MCLVNTRLGVEQPVGLRQEWLQVCGVELSMRGSSSNSKRSQTDGVKPDNLPVVIEDPHGDPLIAPPSEAFNGYNELTRIV